MSLLLGARGKSHLVVMTDGLSITKDDKGSHVDREDVQKLVASSAHPFVIANHGVNRFGRVGAESLLLEVIRHEVDRVWVQGLNVTTGKIIVALDSIVSQQLKTMTEQPVFGVWLAGFWPCTDLPEIVELLWFRMGERRVRVEVKVHGNLVLGGSGAKHLAEFLRKPLDDQFASEKIFDQPAAYSVEFLKRLYRTAIERQTAAGERTFGGQARIAVVTPNGVDLSKV